MAVPMSGQKAITTAGTAEQFGTSEHVNVYLFRAHHANTGTYMYIGNDGDEDVSSANGLPLAKTDAMPVRLRCAPKDVWVDTDTSGDKLCWVKET